MSRRNNKKNQQIVIPAPALRNETIIDHLRLYASGTGGSGAHRNRTRDVECGRCPEKHKRDLRDEN
jgi:hypothetical protein